LHPESSIDLDKREYILSVAERLFTENGFKGTSTRAIAGEAGVNLGMLTYYFGSKEKIFKILIERRIIFFKSDLSSNLDEQSDYWGKLDHIADVYVEHFLSNPGFHRMLHREFSIGSPSESVDFARSLIMKNRIQIIRLVEEGIRNKVFRKSDIHLVLGGFFGTILQFIHNKFMAAEFLDLPDTEQDLYGQTIKERIKTFLKLYFRNMLSPEINQGISDGKN